VSSSSKEPADLWGGFWPFFFASIVGASAVNTMDDDVPKIVMGPHTGLLTLSASRAEALVARDPLDHCYTMENQPFARGKFAAVKRCRNTSTGEAFAAKVIRKRRRGPGMTSESLHEAATLDLCRPCPHIVRLEKVFDTPGETILILQLAEGGELQSVLDRDEIPEEAVVVRFLRQVLRGLAFLHEHNIAHLDLKPQNLLLTGAFPDCDIKLCDFGIARHIARGADVREILGTPDYVAPEVLNYEPISLATDMWSVGVLAYVLLTGCSPFGGDSKQETFCNITRCQLEFPDDLFADVSATAIQFISSLLVHDPSGRLTVQDCLDHCWLLESVSLDTTVLSYQTFQEELPSAYSSNSTIVPDEDDVKEDVETSTEMAEAAQVEQVFNEVFDNSALVATETPAEVKESKLGAVNEDTFMKDLPINRRAGSLPFRWRVPTPRRDASCDRASDLGYGSDGISEMSSTDSSSDRSSIISLDDSPLEMAVMRRYSDTSLAAERLWRRTWERFLPATAGTCSGLPGHLFHQDRRDRAQEIRASMESNKPWERICNGSLARAMDKFNSPTAASLASELSQSTLCLSSPEMNKISEVRKRQCLSPPEVKKVSEVRKRLLVHLDQAEIVKSRLAKFQTPLTPHPSTGSS